ncbi:MAG: gamma-glutamyl-gamma-aminobutyrate hydrolase family protein, partial [Planctomycetes bacterium]|nr:gamma-glutamyl-gamma-aminobutyrate hydrolase family protein [Planctomycetota bacterium]
MDAGGSVAEGAGREGASIPDTSAFDGEFLIDDAPLGGAVYVGTPSASGGSVLRKNLTAIGRTCAHAAELIERAAETGIPMLGICFGHQILASALCGRDQVFRRQTCEVGYRWLDVEPGAVDDSVARDLVPRVYMFVWHNDEVRAEHPDINVLATSPDCPNHIWRFRDLPIWGIQGHPEVTLDQS